MITLYITLGLMVFWNVYFWWVKMPLELVDNIGAFIISLPIATFVHGVIYVLRRQKSTKQ